MNSVDQALQALYFFREVEEALKHFVASTYFDTQKDENEKPRFIMYNYESYDYIHQDIRNALCNKKVKQMIMDIILDRYRYELDSAARTAEKELKDIGDLIANVRTAVKE
jgi:hypothetical protein